MYIIQFQAAILYMLGVLGFAFIKIASIKKEFPNEAAEIKVFRTYWTREWPSFGLSTIGLFVWVLLIPEFLGREILHYEVKNLYRFISVGIGVGNQAFWLALFGASKAAASKLHMEKRVEDAKETGKQEGVTETLSKIAPADAAAIQNQQ